MANDHYPTPSWLRNIFPSFFDPCPLHSTEDGLNMEWGEWCYVNPPYSNPLPWIEKAIEESKKGKTIVMLLPVDTSTKWFSKLIESKAHIFWHSGRLSFNGGSPPRFASMLVILNNEST